MTLIAQDNGREAASLRDLATAVPTMIFAVVGTAPPLVAVVLAVIRRRLRPGRHRSGRNRRPGWQLAPPRRRARWVGLFR